MQPGDLFVIRWQRLRRAKLNFAVVIALYRWPATVRLSSARFLPLLSRPGIKRRSAPSTPGAEI